jgi:hypothetical protein
MLKQEIYNYLVSDSRFRERINKNRGIANLISKKYGVVIPKDKRDDFIADILSADRCWRKTLEDNENLRGQDYGDKDLVEEKFIKTLF